MKNKPLIVLVILTMLTSCFNTKDITKTKFREERIELTVTPKAISKEIKEGVTITITPISADSLNNHCYSLSNGNGVFNYSSSYAYSVDYKTEEINNNVNSTLDEITQDVKEYCNEIDYEKRKVDIILSNLIEIYGNEKEKNHKKDFIVQNPYFINNRYLSVYNIEINNQTDNDYFLKISDINIITGNENLPLYESKILKTYQNAINNQILIDRLNMPSTLLVKRKEKISKYISTPPINFNEKKLKIYIQNQLFSFDIDYKETIIEEEFKFNRFHISYSNVSPKTSLIVIVNNSTLDVLEVDDKDILIPDNLKDETIDVISFYKTSNNFYFHIDRNINSGKQSLYYIKMERPQKRNEGKLKENIY